MYVQVYHLFKCGSFCVIACFVISSYLLNMSSNDKPIVVLWLYKIYAACECERRFSYCKVSILLVSCTCQYVR